MKAESRFFYFKDERTNDGIETLKFFNLKNYNAFRTSKSYEELYPFLDQMLYYKMQNSKAQIFNLTHSVNEDPIISIISKRFIQTQEETLKDPIIMIVINEDTLNKISDLLLTLFGKIIRGSGRDLGCYLFLVNSDKDHIKIDHLRYAFGPIDHLFSLKIDPITIVLSNDNAIKLKLNIPIDLNSKIQHITPTPVGSALWPIIILCWNFFTWIVTKMGTIQIGSIIALKKDPSQAFSILYEDSQFYYLLKLDEALTHYSELNHFGEIYGKIDKNQISNFKLVNWTEH